MLNGYFLNLHPLIIHLSFDSLTSEELISLPTELKVAQESSVTMDLTNVTNENVVTQRLRKSLTFAYKKVSRAEIFIELKVSGRRNNPDVVIKPIIKHAVNETDNDVLVSVSKLDCTKYDEKNKTRRLEAVEDESYEYTYIKGNTTLLQLK